MIETQSVWFSPEQRVNLSVTILVQEPTSWSIALSRTAICHPHGGPRRIYHLLCRLRETVHCPSVIGTTTRATQGAHAQPQRGPDAGCRCSYDW